MPANAQKPKLIAVVGATSTGKTAFSIQLAKSLGGEVVSVDSRQVYRGLNLGTGKVTKKEMGGVPHHMLDIASPKQTYTASTFTSDARRAIGEILNRGNIPILCGGTGFYLDMLLGRISTPEVPPNKVLRAKLSKKNATELYKQLKKLDPTRARSIDRRNPARLIRAIEIATALGKVPKVVSNEPYQTLTIGLTLSQEILEKRIKTRLQARLRAGMLREARKLHASGLSWKRMEELGLEYRYMARHLQGRISKREMELQLFTEIVHYAKRQKTWFKRDKKISWISPSDTKRALRTSRAFLKQ